MNLTVSKEYVQPLQIQSKQEESTTGIRGTPDNGSVRPSMQGKRPSLSVWEVLPNELLCNILRRLPFQDLVSCQRLNQRTAHVIRDNLLLPQAYWKRLQLEPIEERFSAEEYDREIRTWLMEAGQGSEVLWLDSLKLHSIFPKLLFYTISKTLGQAESWDLEKKWQIQLGKGDEATSFFMQGGCEITPDGRSLMYLEETEKNLDIIMIQTSTSQTEKYSFPLDLESVHSVNLSPNCQIVAIVHLYGAVSMVEKESGCWIRKYRNAPPCPHQPVGIDFSMDSRYFLITSVSGNLRVLAREESGWVSKIEINTQFYIQSALFGPGLQSVVIASLGGGLTVKDVESNKLVAQYQDWNFVHQVSDGSLAVGYPGTLLAIVTCKKGEWRKYPVQSRYDQVSDVHFSPDGQHLVVISNQGLPSMGILAKINVISFDGTNWRESGRTEKNSLIVHVCFSPDGRLFFASSELYSNCSSVQADFSNGKWLFHDTSANGVADRPMFFSPDGQMVVDFNFHVNEGCMKLLRHRVGEWSVVHEIKGFDFWSVQFFPDNRRLFVINNDAIQLLQIKPKNSNCPLATEPT